MSAGTRKRIISMWLPRLPSERWARRRTVEGAFALSITHGNSEVIHCLNPAAERLGMRIGMAASQARALCPDLILYLANPAEDARFLHGLRRWAMGYAPWVVCEGVDGLALDITGAAHLHGGEAALLATLDERLRRTGMTARMGVADTRGAAWALARYAPGIAAAGSTLAALAPLPVSALGVGDVTGLQRLGLRTIGALHDAPRAPLARRFGPELLDRLDRVLGTVADPLPFAHDRPDFYTDMALAEPIGLLDDLKCGLDLLLQRLCEQLLSRLYGARVFEFTCHRVDRAAITVPLRLAAPMREAARILPLFARQLEGLDAGFGIDRLELRATLAEPLPIAQMGPKTDKPLADLLTRIGTRIGLENIHRFAACDTHWPERSFALHPATDDLPPQNWPKASRPITIFSPEGITAKGSHPPQAFRWRGMSLTTAHATGPERIAPEWWISDDPLRDYWRVQTHQGRRLWMFHTPQRPNWYVQGEFL